MGGSVHVWIEMDTGGKRCGVQSPQAAQALAQQIVELTSIDLDGGMKTFASYPPTPYGHCVEFPELKIYSMSVEHGHVDASASTHRFKVGDRLTWIPLHQEMCLNLHDEAVGFRGEQVEVIWSVLGRGKVK